MANPQTTNTQGGNNTALEALHQARDKCEKAYTNVDATRDQLRGGWAGDASTVYQEAMVQWLDQLRLTINDMNQKIDSWGGTATKMYDTEDSNLATSGRWSDALNKPV
ncbi:hypothetical protein GCM10027570_29060 [Streptomonospora sediminis]